MGEEGYHQYQNMLSNYRKYLEKRRLVWEHLCKVDQPNKYLNARRQSLVSESSQSDFEH
eukprot:NODE_1822_length_541_cov_315.063008_g1477_i0.p2 GENE.NODE_1822_length_541_cov_315.063008_g1477_i0~~NODE_1822_length_541_cov_315.063008_g1477_i0.p2  ORF type:complete len:67 (-),score=23.50 NODE_1822_length_541_cov_315.063008_g1477_i0:339-515(-)